MVIFTRGENLQFVIQDPRRAARVLVEILRCSTINGTGLGIHEYPEEYYERARYIHPPPAASGSTAKIGEVDYRRHPRGTWEIDT